MNKPEKAEQVEGLRSTLGAAKAAVLTDFRGLSVVDLSDLRKHLRKASVSYKVVKNTLARRALQSGPLEGLARHFEGPTGVAYSQADPLALARAITAWAKGRPTFIIKAGVLEGKLLGPAEIAAVAALPGRQALLSQMLSVLQAPVRSLASVLHGILRGLAGVLDQVRQRKDTGETGGTPMAKVSVDDVLESIDGWTVLDLNRLVKGIEEKYGVTAAAPVAAAAAPGAAPGAAAAPAEEKTEFTVVLANTGPNKIQVIKEVRAVTALGLKEAKDLVEGAPKPVKEGISKAEAEEIKAKLEAVGATVELT
jgi:large subunit ribosomal protein L7/L12